MLLVSHLRTSRIELVKKSFVTESVDPLVAFRYCEKSFSFKITIELPTCHYMFSRKHKSVRLLTRDESYIFISHSIQLILFTN